MVTKGTKVHYQCGSIWNDGEVLCINDDGTFTVYDPRDKCPAQYNDSVRDFTEQDIGKSVFLNPDDGN